MTKRPIIDVGQRTHADTVLGITDTQVVITITNHDEPHRRLQAYLSPGEARAYAAKLRADAQTSAARVLVSLACTCGCASYFSAEYPPAGVLTFADQITEAVTILEQRS